MEKSFLNFKVSVLLSSSKGRKLMCVISPQAAYPEWQPSDPSGSLYLSRMADLTTIGLGRRRLLRRSGDFGHGMESTTLQPERKTDTTDRISDDRASVYNQSVRRRGSTLAQSRLSPSSIFQSSAGLGMAQTAILGDSAGSVLSPPPPKSNVQASTIPEEDFMEDGGVRSPLGESYVDGRPKGPSVSQSQQEEDEVLEDGGVLGLLAQIYGTTADLSLKGRGAPRAI